jgi:cell division transport system permease protein
VQGTYKCTAGVSAKRGFLKMKNFLYNKYYFIKEAKTILKLNLISNILSILSMGLMFLLLAMVLSGWWTSNKVTEAIKGESEIDVYYKEGTKQDSVTQLALNIKGIQGVREVRLIDENEAYSRMVNILGKDSDVLKYLEENPFSPFIEVKINLDNMDTILAKLSNNTEIEQVRDNHEVLDKIKSLTNILKLLGSIIVIVVAACTMLIISHIIRLGIYNNREQINTLRLLGAPEYFIALPFLLQGLAMTLAGGLLSSITAGFTIKKIYSMMAGPLPFIPLPPLRPLISGVIMLTIVLSIVLGISGSLLGMASDYKT